jgi:dTDP-4-amino-4,6-dideoxygalactose transaminase
MFTFLVDEAALGVSRNRFVRAMRAEGVPCGVGNEPVYRSPLFPLESAEYRKACELARASGNEVTAVDCPVAERIFAHEMVAIPHECLLGDDRDLYDIVAAVRKVASRAAELNQASLATARN